LYISPYQSISEAESRDKEIEEHCLSIPPWDDFLVDMSVIADGLIAQRFEKVDGRRLETALGHS